MCETTKDHILECIQFILDNPSASILPCGDIVSEFAVRHVLKHSRRVRKRLEYKPTKCLGVVG